MDVNWKMLWTPFILHIFWTFCSKKKMNFMSKVLRTYTNCFSKKKELHYKNSVGNG